jgi:four helix bundle protein
MRKENIILEKTFSFSIRIVKLYKHLVKNYKEYDLFRQLLRSGTSIGANMEEAQGGYSKKEFLSKVAIAYKEARETRYWIRLLHSTSYITTEEFDSLEVDIEEISKIITSIQVSVKKKYAKRLSINYK